MARFYYLLETGQLVTPEYSRSMKSILGNPAINHKFVKGLKSVHPDSQLFRKSGTWQEFHSDSAIVEHEGRRYIAVALAQSPDGGRWLSTLITAMDELIRHSGPVGFKDDHDRTRAPPAGRHQSPAGAALTFPSTVLPLDQPVQPCRQALVLHGGVLPQHV